MSAKKVFNPNDAIYYSKIALEIKGPILSPQESISNYFNEENFKG